MFVTTPLQRCPLGGGGSLCGHIIVQVTIYRRLRIGRDGYLDQSEAYDIIIVTCPRIRAQCNLSPARKIQV